MYSGNFGDKLFPDAAKEWLKSRLRLSTRSRNGYHDHIKHLTGFFGLMRLREIHLGHVVTYQRSRQEQIRSSKQHRAATRTVERRESDGASGINHEVSCLAQVLGRAGLWAEIKRFYEPLPLPKGSIGIALTAEEEGHLFKVASSRPRWLIAYCCSLISRNTTAGPSEIRYLRLCDVELDTDRGSFIHIEEGVKNEFRKRPVPLNRDGEWAVRTLLERARELGAEDPTHYLLPHRAHERGAKPDPTRPMGSWKKAHYAMCKEAGKKFPRLVHLRRYDFRHTAATELLENPAVSFTTIEHVMGHRLSSKTKRKYDHVRNDALRVAVDALNRDYKDAPAPMPSVPRKAAQVVSIANFRSRANS